MTNTSSDQTVTIVAAIPSPLPPLTAADLAQLPVHHAPKLVARWEEVDGRLVCQWFHNPD